MIKAPKASVGLRHDWLCLVKAFFYFECGQIIIWIAHRWGFQNIELCVYLCLCAGASGSDSIPRTCPPKDDDVNKNSKNTETLFTVGYTILRILAQGHLARPRAYRRV